jgi:hypothetical protein
MERMDGKESLKTILNFLMERTVKTRMTFFPQGITTCTNPDCKNAGKNVERWEHKDSLGYTRAVVCEACSQDEEEMDLFND